MQWKRFEVIFHARASNNTNQRDIARNGHQHVFTQTPRTCYSFKLWRIHISHAFDSPSHTIEMILANVLIYIISHFQAKKCVWHDQRVCFIVYKWFLPSSLFLNSLSWHALVNFCRKVTNVYLLLVAIRIRRLCDSTKTRPFFFSCDVNLSHFLLLIICSLTDKLQRCQFSK